MARMAPQQWIHREPGLVRPGEERVGEYLAFVPDPLTGRAFKFSGQTMVDVSEAERAIMNLNASAKALKGTEGLARLLLRAEASASSRIEGIEVGAQRLLRAEAARDLDSQGRPDPVADDVLANIDAMKVAMELADEEAEITADSILRVHERVLRGGDLGRFAGKLRTTASWIGGSAYHPFNAAFVPPPPRDLPRLLDDLAAFINDRSMPPIAHAAIAHAQFETIHPFVDGNGRTGRALIHVMLRRSGVAPMYCPPVSLVLATLARDYYAALNAYHIPGSPDSPEVVQAIDEWVSFFSRACTRSVHDALLFEQRVQQIQEVWRSRLAPVRSGSSVDLLIDALPSMVIMTVQQAADVLGRSFTAANAAVDQLVKAKILKQINVGKRNRAFEATELVSAFTELERRLASPAGDTRFEGPVRPVPWRGRKTPVAKKEPGAALEPGNLAEAPE